MIRSALLVSALLSFTALLPAETTPREPEYTSDGQLKFPADYRQWIFLSSGVGMTYGPLAPSSQGPPPFDNVFVNPAAYRAFLQTGQWPDKTVFVLEIRNSESHASINQAGHFQRQILGIEAEVKDSSAPPGLWSFYGFPLSAGKAASSGKVFPRDASCYSCHTKNTAVENTFVQFYPELYDVALRKGTIKPDFAKLPITASDLLDLIKESGWSKAAPVVQDVARRTPDAAVLSETSLNNIGYGLLQSKRVADSVAVFEMAAVRYPKSPNAQDSLADAYLASGNKKASAAATERTLVLLKEDTVLPADRKGQIMQSALARKKNLEP